MFFGAWDVSFGESSGEGVGIVRAPPRLSGGMRLAWAITATLVGCAHRPEVGVEDLHAALSFVEAVHPDPSQVDLDAARAAVLSEAARRDPRQVPSYELRVRGAQAVVGALGDAHVVLGTPPRAIEGVVPVLPVLVEGQVYVDAFVHELPRGTVLRAIDGVPAMEWIDRLGALTSVDGGRVEVRRAQAVRSFGSLMHRYGGPRTDWSIETEAPDGQRRTWTVPGVDREGARALATARVSAPAWGVPGDGAWPLWVPTGDADTALLRLPGFGTREHDAWKARLDEGFAALRGDETLIVDLRGNAGGARDLGVLVAQRLLDRPFAQWASVSTRVRTIPRRHRARVGFPFVPEEALTAFPGARVDGGWRVEGDPLAETMRPVAPRHRGPVVVFVDDGTSSAAVELAVALLAFHDDVVVVGTATQGACGRHAGQLPVTYDLGDGVVLMMSLFEVALVPSPGCQPGGGVPIDVPVRPSMEGWVAGEDPWWTAFREAAQAARAPG